MSADACPMYPSNKLRSAAYGSTLSLVTLGFWDLVCSSVASVYFAIVGLLQILTPFSPTGKYATLLPYLGNKLIELLFVYRANAKRMLSDHLINSRPVRVLRDDGIVRIHRSQIVVGDLLLLEAEWRDEEVPVDLILLSSATDVFLCLASLTGEKDPVRKVPVPGLSLARTLSEEHKNVYGVCSSPSHREHLDLFHAELRLGAERYRITSDSFLPAGSTLLHGSEVFGLVFATGPDCKVAVSDAQVGTARRFNLLDTKLNVLTQVTLVLLVLFIFIGSAGKLMSTELVSFSDTVPVVILYFLLFNGLIAQTLQFSLTLVRGYQGESVPEDDKNNISTFEQMCLCDAVVFDKTGTLTANILQPKYIGLPLDHNSTSNNRSISSQTHNSSGIPTLSRQVSDVGSPDSLASPSPSFSPTPTLHRASSLLLSSSSSSSSFSSLSQLEDGICNFYGSVTNHNNNINNNNHSKMRKIPWRDISTDLHHMFLATMLNNSVMPRPSRRQLEFFGTSSDEVAILDSVHRFSDYSFSRTQLPSGDDEIRITSPHATDAAWTLIHTFKYSSAKGKMTVIVRRQSDDAVFVIVKGSPSKVASLLEPSFLARANALVHTMASEGLRILMFAWRRIPDWDAEFQSDFEERRRAEDDPMLLDEMLPVLEVDLVLLGVTGTQDNLHPLVDKTIQRFQEARVKTLLCTGDIRETATNIGFNSAILPNPARHPNSRVFDISVDSSEDLHQQLQAAIEFAESEGAGPIGVVVGSREIPALLNSDHLSDAFVKLIAHAQGVVIARADPEMKLAVTQFLMRHCGYMTMAVGDGANDIPMLRAAHVSVGIKSGENQNAAAASDLAVRVVTDLPHRVFDLSPTFWRRNTKIPKFIASMKLSVILTLLISEVFHGFPGKSMFTGTQLLFFNFFYGWSVLAHGITYANPSLSRDRADLLREVSFSAFFDWVLITFFDTVFAFASSSWFFTTEPSVPFFGDLISSPAFANWMLLVCITNLRVSLDVGISLPSLKAHKWVHLSVLVTISVFLFIVVLPRLLHISSLFLLKFVVALVAHLILVTIVSSVRSTSNSSIDQKDSTD